MRTVEELEAKLSEPSQALISEIAQLEGDIMILGVGGKMGPSLAKLAKNAIDKAKVDKKVIGVSRFSNKELQRELEDYGIQTINADLLEDDQLQSLPEVKNVIFMAGHKFGTTGNEHFTWAMNAYLPGQVAKKFKNSRIVVFSSGNVYPLTPVFMGGASEEYPTGPVGEYAQSVLGRERVFEHFSRKYNIPMLIMRLNYAIDLRYGVLHEIATFVKEQKPIDLRMGHVNVIWQGDANEIALRSLRFCEVPPKILNVTGPETISVRWLAERFGEKFGIRPIFVNEEEDTALLSNASKAHYLFGYPRVSLRQMIEWTAEWIKSGGVSLGKPTHFQEREGKF
ncbi:NAD-dependent epimerase/dehydratase family protein [Caldanaerobacter subterraneus]|uniref:NAD-dependent epimerase/dehydratase family protein n=1 Tax=Caldanaerobacter subterraneus TaxID=911092 RepID=UPI00175066DA|nr:NAD(P)-dependent oxidoreductase [Clostridia bacterium]